MQNLQELKNDKQREKNYVNYSKNFLIFIGKFVIKQGPEILYQLVESIQQGLLDLLLKSESDKISLLNSGIDKKIVLYGICMFLNDYYSKLREETVLFIVIQFVKMLETFSKLGSSFIGEKGLDLQENLVFVANSSNKLQNAEIKVLFF